jgi:hypothetical protein
MSPMRLMLLCALALYSRADEFGTEDSPAVAAALAGAAAPDAQPASDALAPPPPAAAAAASALPALPAAAAAAAPAPPTLLSRLWLAAIAVLGAASIIVHQLGRMRNAALASAASQALLPTLRANFSHPLAASAVPREEGAPVPHTLPSALHSVTLDEAEGYSSGRRGGVLGLLATLRTQARTKPTWWLPAWAQERLGGAPGRAWDALTLELPLAAAPAPPPGLLSLVEPAALPALRRRGDMAAFVREKDAALGGLVPALPHPLVALGDHAALYAALLKAAPALEAALRPGSATLGCLAGLHYTDSATLAALRTAALSEHCLVVTIKCPPADAGATAWEGTVGAWTALALTCGDALGGLKTSAQASVEGARAAIKREEARRALEAKLAKERQEALAKLSPSALFPPPPAPRFTALRFVVPQVAAGAHARTYFLTPTRFSPLFPPTHHLNPPTCARAAAAEQINRMREEQLKAMKKKSRIKH